jgi:hypothetical protein
MSDPLDGKYVWYDRGFRKWFLWPHDYPPPSHLLHRFVRIRRWKK